MATIPHPFTCDARSCTQRKGEGNKWMLGLVIGRDFRLSSPSHPGDIPRFGYAIIPWDEELARSPHVRVHHICSEQCAIRIQSEYIREPYLKGEPS